MNIVVIDDKSYFLKNIAQVLIDGGHQVLTFNPNSRTLTKNEVEVTIIDIDEFCDLNRVAERIRAFMPDKILIDHQMPCYGGQQLAMVIGFDRSRFIGISSVRKWQETYCATHFEYRDRTSLSSSEKKALLEMLTK